MSDSERDDINKRPKGASRVVEDGKVIAEWSDSLPAPIHKAAFTELEGLCRLFDVADGNALRDLLASVLPERDAIRWLSSRLSSEEHAELHKSNTGYAGIEALICDASGSVIVRGDGASLGAALDELRRADEDGGQG